MVKPPGKALRGSDSDRVLDDFDDDARKPGNVDKFADGGMRKVRAAHDFGNRNQGLVKTDLHTHDGVFSPAGKAVPTKR